MGLQCRRKHGRKRCVNPCVNVPDTAVSLDDIFAQANCCHTANKRLIQLFKRKGKQLSSKAALEMTELTHRFTFFLAEAPYLSLWATELIQRAFDVFPMEENRVVQPYSVTTKTAKAALEKQTKHI